MRKSGLVKTIIETPELINFVQDGIDLLHSRPNTPFLCISPLEVIHEGWYINCDQKEFTAKAICAALAAQDFVNKVNGSEKHLKLAVLFKVSFSLYFYHFHYNLHFNKQANGTIQARYTILRGSKNIKDVGKIVSVNGERLLEKFDDDNCNVINGTDMDVFPPKQQKDEEQWIYAHDFCRSLVLQYGGRKRIHGIKTMMKELNWNSNLVKKI